MKKFQPLQWILLAFLALQITGCDNETFEGEIPIDDTEGVAEEGEFIATIDGESFVAENTQAVLFTETNVLQIVGAKASTGELITIAIENPSVAEFDLSQSEATLNGAAYLDGSDFPNPYVSSIAFGGTGTLDLTMFDTDGLTISGNFAFTGARIQLDADGNPVIDGDGNPVIQTININAGAFNTIPYTIDDTMGGGGTGGGGTTDPDELFANVDGVSFTPIDVTVSQYMVGMQPMIQINAMDAQGASIRLDVPETLETGEFSMFNGISDGSMLIGYYNSNTGGEVLSSNPGTINITEFSSQTGKLVATFEFTARDPLNVDPTIAEITEGSIDVTFVPTPGNVTFFFEADIDGGTYTPDMVEATQGDFNGVQVVTILASLGNRTMQLNFPASIGPGSYGMSPLLSTGNEIVGMYTPDLGTSSVFSSDPGTLEIISFDTTTGIIEGTFSFTGKDQTTADPTVYDITNGSFLIELQ